MDTGIICLSITADPPLVPTTRTIFSSEPEFIQLPDGRIFNVPLVANAKVWTVFGMIVNSTWSDLSEKAKEMVRGSKIRAQLVLDSLEYVCANDLTRAALEYRGIRSSGNTPRIQISGIPIYEVAIPRRVQRRVPPGTRSFTTRAPPSAAGPSTAQAPVLPAPGAPVMPTLPGLITRVPVPLLSPISSIATVTTSPAMLAPSASTVTTATSAPPVMLSIPVPTIAPTRSRSSTESSGEETEWLSSSE